MATVIPAEAKLLVRVRTVTKSMQEVVPSCYFGLGAGPGPMLHDPGYDFNDALLVKGPAFWARLVERALAPA